MLVMLLNPTPSWTSVLDYVVMNDKVFCDGSSCAGVGAHACADTPAQGAWGYTFSGTFILPTGATPAVAAGTLTIDADGRLSGTQHSSVGGVSGEERLKGIATSRSDCTGTLTVDIYDSSGTLARTAVWETVYVDDGNEVLPAPRSARRL